MNSSDRRAGTGMKAARTVVPLFLAAMLGAPLTAEASAAAPPPGGPSLTRAAASDIEVIRTLEKAAETSLLVRELIYAFASLFLIGLFLDVRFVWRRLRRRAPPPPLRLGVGWSVLDVTRAVLVFFMAVVVLRAMDPVARRLLGASDISLTVATQFLAEVATIVFILQLIPGGWSSAVRALRLTANHLPRRLALGVKAYIGFLPVLFVLNLITEEVASRAGIHLESQRQIGFFFVNLSTPAFLFLVVFVSFLGPLIEEIFFRGFAYQALRRRFSRWPSIVLTSLLFSALHANVAVFLPILGLGVLLAYVFETSGSLIPSITIHVCQNSVSVAGVLLVRLYG